MLETLVSWSRLWTDAAMTRADSSATERLSTAHVWANDDDDEEALSQARSWWRSRKSKSWPTDDWTDEIFCCSTTKIQSRLFSVAQCAMQAPPASQAAHVVSPKWQSRAAHSTTSS